MMTDEEMLRMIEEAVSNYQGDISYMNEAVGLIVVGRLMGWEHQRLISTRDSWTFATKLFGDPKKLMEKRTALAQRKSRALHVVDNLLAAGSIVRGYVDLVTRRFSYPKVELQNFD